MICFLIQVKQRVTFKNVNSEVLELSSCWGENPGALLLMAFGSISIVSCSLPKAGTILLSWGMWFLLCYQTSQAWEQSHNACCRFKDP